MEGKNVVITGGADGIGFGLAQELLKRKCKVCVLDINTSKLKEKETELGEYVEKKLVRFFKCDVTDFDLFSATMKQCVQFLGYFDIFVNNAGISNEVNYEKCIAVNITAVVHGTNLAMKHMDKQTGGRGGQILNVSSSAGLKSSRFIPVYSGTKSAVLTYTLALSKDPLIDSKGIYFHAICPSFTETPMLYNGVPKNEEISDFIQKHGVIPLERTVGAFIKILEDKKNGGVIKVTIENVAYVEF